MFPIMLKVRDRQCLVVGGGTVAMRKANNLLAAGARVTLVCLEPSPAHIQSGLDWRMEPYHSNHLEGMSLVCAAATKVINATVVADSQARHIWVNSATDPESGDFILPAVGRRGGIEIAVSTGGASPALAASIRDHLASHLDDSVVAWVDLIAEVRAEVLLALSPESSRTLLREFAQATWLERIRAEGTASVRQAIREVVDRERGR
jgi:precorrin-2 dehydrogenase / sirohydrochlorin ferrochelatase